MNTTNTCIIFDMDGTLWDASDNIAAAYNALLHEQRGWDGYCTGDDLRAVAGMEIAEIARALFPQLSEQEGLALTMSCMSYENEYLSRHGGVGAAECEASADDRDQCRGRLCGCHVQRASSGEVFRRS